MDWTATTSVTKTGRSDGTDTLNINVATHGEPVATITTPWTGSATRTVTKTGLSNGADTVQIDVPT